jgi:hypothetical protein
MNRPKFRSEDPGSQRKYAADLVGPHSSSPYHRRVTAASGDRNRPSRLAQVFGRKHRRAGFPVRDDAAGVGVVTARHNDDQ